MSSPWSVKLSDCDGLTVAAITGEVDLAGAPMVFDQIAAAAGDRPVVVDMARVAFIDSSGIGRLLLLCQKTSVRLVVAPRSQPERVLRITRLLDVLPCFATVDEALTH
jgi:anti-anti-sigma factor